MASVVWELLSAARHSPFSIQVATSFLWDLRVQVIKKNLYDLYVSKVGVPRGGPCVQHAMSSAEDPTHIQIALKPPPHTSLWNEQLAGQSQGRNGMLAHQSCQAPCKE